MIASRSGSTTAHVSQLRFQTPGIPACFQEQWPQQARKSCNAQAGSSTGSTTQVSLLGPCRQRLILVESSCCLLWHTETLEFICCIEHDDIGTSFGRKSPTTEIERSPGITPTELQTLAGVPKSLLVRSSGWGTCWCFKSREVIVGECPFYDFLLEVDCLFQPLAKGQLQVLPIDAQTSMMWMDNIPLYRTLPPAIRMESVLMEAYGKICKAGSNAKTVELALFMPYAILVVIACHASQKASLAETSAQVQRSAEVWTLDGVDVARVTWVSVYTLDHFIICALDSRSVITLWDSKAGFSPIFRFYSGCEEPFDLVLTQDFMVVIQDNMSANRLDLFFWKLWLHPDFEVEGQSMESSARRQLEGRHQREAGSARIITIRITVL
ncbi:unnamed protein product [Symbiodinium necroappetens]|uniref:Uncharacterized protein n=1 Tax=Symbiodinium necroappetens TaxID=1628268 RepID=A0A812R273_9DINO|nr:unnamed protein product [Symbiodinium necroappetens]